MTDAALFRSPELLDRSRSRLLVVDVQEKLLPAIAGADELVRRIRFLMDAAELFEVPTVVSEQYPQGLGSTISQLADHPAIGTRFDKVCFSAAEGFCTAFGYAAELDPESVDDHAQVVVTGMESHVCVLQTALDLLGRGFRVFIVEDAVGSGRRHDHDVAIQRLNAAGAAICTAESVAFEWCHAAASDPFRTLSQLVRRLRADS